MKTKLIKILSVLMLGSILIASAFQPGVAATSAAAPMATYGLATGQLAGPTDPKELEAFLDEFITAHMEEDHIPGVTVSVVKDGKLYFAKGYGYADLEEQVPVDPEATLFRIGSVSKLITWTTVMQLLEQGVLSLDGDINEYLDFTIPATFPEALTIRHLMSHTPGFEDLGLTYYRLHADQVSPLGDYLKANVPARVFPPGEVAAYSNYGAALAGYIVERMSGQPFDEYAEQNIFTPLGMAHSTFRQPLPGFLSAYLAKGYNYTNGRYVAGSFVFDQPYPGGSISTTATDMARFMIAHLQNGHLDGQRILQEETAIEMHSQLYTPDPRLDSGMAYGFVEEIINGQRILSHTGNLLTHMSGLYMIPDQSIGLFISTNSTSGIATVMTIDDAFVYHYYSNPKGPEIKSVAGFAERVTPYLGEYTPARGNFTSFEKMVALTAPIHVSLGSDDTLVLSKPGREVRFVEVEPGLLQEIGEPVIGQLVYRTNSDGRKFLMNGTFAVFRTPWYGSVNLHRLLFGSCTLLFMVALIAWPIGFFTTRRKQRPDVQFNPLPARLARWTAAIFGLLWLVSLLGIASIFANILPGFGVTSIQVETPPQLTIILSLTYVLIGLALVMPVFTVLAWLRRYWSLGGRIFYSLLALLAMFATWSLIYWDMLL